MRYLKTKHRDHRHGRAIYRRSRAGARNSPDDHERTDQLTVDLNDGSAPTLVLDNVTGATSGTANDLNYITNCDAGLMQLELAAANVNYVGRAFLTITDAANHCPVFHEFTILPAQVYDSLILGTDLLQADTTQIGGTAQTARDLGASVLLSSGTGTGQLSITSGVVAANATQISGDATAADNAEAFFDGTGYAGTNNVIPTVTTVGTATNLTNLPAAAATAAEPGEGAEVGLERLLECDGAGGDPAEAQDAITASALASAKSRNVGLDMSTPKWRRSWRRWIPKSQPSRLRLTIYPPALRQSAAR